MAHTGAEGTVPNRWLIVAAGIVIQLCLGALYAFSVFRDPLIERFGWTITETSLTFTLSLVFFTLSVIIAGRWQDKVGPRKVATIGGVLLGLGFILASQTQSLIMLYISYGAIAGSGVGFAYVTPVATIMKWFPDKRGLMAGLAVFGFGIGSLIFAPLSAALIIDYNVLNTFAILGLIFLIAVAGSSQFLQNPPQGWKPPGWDPPEPKNDKNKDPLHKEYSPGAMLQTWRFWVVWAIFLIGSSAGLMVISQASPMGQQVAGITPEAAGAAVGIMAIFNGIGRVFWGVVSDKLGRSAALTIMFSLKFIALFIILPSASSYLVFLIGICTIALPFGGYMSVMPSITADYFGTKNLGVNYGAMFTAYGTAAVFGPILIARLEELTGGYVEALYILAALSLVAIALTFLNKREQVKSVSHGM